MARWTDAFLQAASGHPITAAVVISALLASDFVMPIPSSVLSTGAGFLLGFGRVDAEENHVLARLVKTPGSFQVSSFLLTGFAPGSPEINQYNFTPQIRKLNSLAIIGGQGKIGGYLTDTYWALLGTAQTKGKYHQ